MVAEHSNDERAANLVRARYNRAARFYDREQSMMERLAGRWREELWSKLPAGSVLEVGVGTGINMRFYPPERAIVAVDIADKMLARAEQRAKSLGVDVELRQMDVQALQFGDASFDSAVGTFVFCSVPDPVAGLREVRRVLKPGGTLLLLEHVRLGNPVLAKLMDAVNPLAVRLSGANVNRRTVENVQAAGFEIGEVATKARGLVKLIVATA